jgi:hypothetical protein
MSDSNTPVASHSLIPEYIGEFASGRFSGTGTYELEGLGKYTGQFANGKFHGYGSLAVAGGKYEGQWEDGLLISGGFIFEDGLAHQRRKWDYCSSKDPRFYKEIMDGTSIDGPLRYEFPQKVAPKLPANCYDLVYGYYDPFNGNIYSYAATKDVLKIPTDEEKEWIEKNCRQGRAMTRQEAEAQAETSAQEADANAGVMDDEAAAAEAKAAAAQYANI